MRVALDAVNNIIKVNVMDVVYDTTSNRKDVKMDILRRVTKEGNVVGVELDMDGYICPFPTKGLYNEQILVALIDAGYKFYNYQGDIDLPSGKNIDSLEAKELSSYAPDEITGFENMSVTADMEALTDAEASAKYYSYRTNMTRVELRTESSYEINTREEFERYIRTTQTMIAMYGYSNDNRPINSFVNPDALYTLSELIEDETGKLFSNLNTLNYRHKFRDYGSYLKCVSYLREKGVLQTDNPTPGEFVQAYSAWGPDGITGDCINLKFKQGVDGEFKTPDDNLPAEGDKDAYVSANRKRVPFIIDVDSTMRYLDKSVSLNGILSTDEFRRKPLAVLYDSVFTELKRRDNKGYKYTLGYAEKSCVSDRVYFTYMVDGYKYLYKMSCNESALMLAYSTTPRWCAYSGFSIATILGNIDLELDLVSSQENYIMWNICINNAANHIKKNTVEAPVMSTYELLMNVGMTPISAVRYIAYHVLNNREYTSNQRVKDRYEGLTIDCVNKYYDPIPEEVLNAFMINPEDLTDGVRTFLDIADVDSLIDRRERQVEGILTPGMPGYDSTFTYGEKNVMNLNDNDALYYYNNMKFVVDCIDGAVSIDAFGDGMIKDSGSTTKVAAEVLMSIVYAELGGTPDIVKATEILNNLDQSRILNTANLFRRRDNAYKGYIIDYSKARKNKAHAENTWAWAYVSKVFRELGNKPIEQTRPYLLELIILQNDKQGMLYRNAIIESVKKAVDESNLFPKERIIDDSSSPDFGITYYDAAVGMLDDVAAKLFFTILGKKSCEEDIEDYIYDVKFDNEHTLKVRINKKVAALCQSVINDKANHVRYITVYDTCEREYNHFADGGSFALHIINADITPWSVVPRKGFKIQTYSLLPSYYRPQALIDKFGDNWYTSAMNDKAISSTPLSSVLPMLEVPQQDTTEQMLLDKELKTMNDYDSFDGCLISGCTEQVAAYVKRWSAACKMAKLQNKIVEHMPLKQDIVYQNLTDIITGEPVQDSLRFKNGENTALCGVEKSVLRWSSEDNLLTMKTHGGIYELSYVRPGEISTELFANIYVQLIHNRKQLATSGNWIIGLGEPICVTTMDESNPIVQKMLRENTIKHDGSYYFAGIKGIYRIGVRYA